MHTLNSAHLTIPFFSIYCKSSISGSISSIEFERQSLNININRFVDYKTPVERSNCCVVCTRKHTQHSTRTDIQTIQWTIQRVTDRERVAVIILFISSFGNCLTAWIDLRTIGCRWRINEKIIEKSIDRSKTRWVHGTPHCKYARQTFKTKFLIHKWMTASSRFDVNVCYGNNETLSLSLFLVSLRTKNWNKQYYWLTFCASVNKLE